MKKRFLIVVGLPKCGTTFLYAETAKRPDAFAMPKGNKEVDFFRRRNDIDSYLELFDGGASGERVYVDASPLYIDDLENSTSNMKTALAGHDVRIVVCLRDPLERAYSHYLHDIAQNQAITAYAEYSFWAATVMAKYLFPLAPRINYLRENFGEENVWGFSFGTDMSAFQNKLRNFAGLDPEWSLNFSINPFPGFTSPQSYYNAEGDIELLLGGTVYRLPAGHMLIANRQFSTYLRAMHRPLAEKIMMRQSSLTRNFNTAMFSDETRARIYDDAAQAANTLGIDLNFDSSPRLLQSKVSDEVPSDILNQLSPIYTLESAVSDIFDTGLQRTMNTTVQMPYVGFSLARDLARVTLAHQNDPAETHTMKQIMRHVIDNYGPIARYVENLMKWELARGNYKEALEIFEGCGGANALLHPANLGQFLNARKITLPDEIVKDFQKAGIRID